MQRLLIEIYYFYSRTPPYDQNVNIATSYKISVMNNPFNTANPTMGVLWSDCLGTGVFINCTFYLIFTKMYM